MGNCSGSLAFVSERLMSPNEILLEEKKAAPEEHEGVPT
jgi:hypothetical protein